MSETEKPEDPSTPPDPTAPETPEQPEDAMSPEAIAKRVDALGEEDELDKIARSEEEKLAERRAKGKTGKKKSGLEAAASKRLEKIGGGKVPPKKVAVAADADPLLARAGELGKWIQANQSAMAVIGAVLAIGLLGGGGYAWWQQHHDSEASAAITAAIDDLGGRVGDAPKDAEDRPYDDLRPAFKTAAERRDAALAKFRDVESKFRGTGAAYLARLEEAGLLLDAKDLDGAQAAYSEASTSPLASADAEVKGRALEGLGFVAEARALANPAEKDKWLDQAATQFKALENTDVKGFKELGMYHEARVAEAKGDKDEAVKVLKSLRERLNPPGATPGSQPYPFLQTVTDDRLMELDPSAIPPKPKGGMPGMRNPMGGGAGGAGGQPQMSDEQMKKLIEQLTKQAHEQGGQGGAPPGPAGSQ